MNCQEARNEIEAYVDGELDAQLERALRAHVAACGGCRERLEAERALNTKLSSAYQTYAATIRPPDGMKEALRAQVRSSARPRRVWPMMAAAAAVLIVAGVAWHVMASFNAEREGLLARYVELSAVQASQDELMRAARQCGEDPALLRILCAYLPKQRRNELLAATGKSADDLEAEDPVKAERVVSLQRSIRKGSVVTELLFEQWSDGRVHVEHLMREGEDVTTTKLDAGTWEILAAQNPTLCRQLEIVDDKGRLLAGLPLPSVGILRRDSLEALHGGPVPPDLLKRLLQLRLATRVKNSEELLAATEIGGVSVPSIARPDISLETLRERVRALERDEVENRVSLKARLEAPEYVRKLCRF